jgi:hypothetical protein
VATRIAQLLAIVDGKELLKGGIRLSAVVLDLRLSIAEVLTLSYVAITPSLVWSVPASAT